MSNKLMIVAHPDDETIFGGGSLIWEKGWKVICVTNGNNTTRAREFKRAMKAVGAEYEIWSFKDSRYGGFDKDSLMRKIVRVLNEFPYEKVVTHNLHGEYGHPQHKALSKIMHRLVGNNLYTFRKSSEVLPYDLLREKINIFRIYKSQRYVYKRLRSYVFYEGLQRVK